MQAASRAQPGLRALLLNVGVAVGAAVWAVRVVSPTRPAGITSSDLALAALLCAAALGMDATRMVWGSDRAGRVQVATAANTVLLPAAILLPPGLSLAVAVVTSLGFVTSARGWVEVVGNATFRVTTISTAALTFAFLAPGWPPDQTDPASVAALAEAGLLMVLTKALLVVNLARGWDGLDARDLPLLQWRELLVQTPEVLLGAVFCLLYPTPGTLLVVGLFVWIHLTVREHARLRLASRDPKTGLLSWPGFQPLADAELRRARRTGQPLALLLMDLDGLKAVNTRHGLLAGDLYIEATAQLLTQSTRNYDLLARFGGDEFALLLPDTTLADAAACAERIRAAIASTRLAGIDAPMGVSIGVAAVHPDQDVRGLLSAADTGLRQAKASNRNQVVVAD
ncbi:MAG: GGDEF domain-containing protein [Candidatus Nanopelagicales bacterium]